MKVGEIFGTGKVVILSKGSYYIDGELTNISKLIEYDKAGILQWESGELRELALSLEVAGKSRSSQILPQSNVEKELFYWRLVRGFIARSESKGWQIAGHITFALSVLAILLPFVISATTGTVAIGAFNLLLPLIPIGILHLAKVLLEMAARNKKSLIILAALGAALLIGASYLVILERGEAAERAMISEAFEEFNSRGRKIQLPSGLQGRYQNGYAHWINPPNSTNSLDILIITIPVDPGEPFCVGAYRMFGGQPPHCIPESWCDHCIQIERSTGLSSWQNARRAQFIVDIADFPERRRDRPFESYSLGEVDWAAVREGHRIRISEEGIWLR